MGLLNWYIKQLSKWKNCENSFSPCQTPSSSLPGKCIAMHGDSSLQFVYIDQCVRVVHISTHLTATLKLGTSLANEMYHAYATLHSM